VNRSLLARTRRDFYDVYAKMLRDAGAAEPEIERAISNATIEARMLLAGKCPKCGEPIRRYVDYKLQQGPSAVPGAWVQYRCSTQAPIGKPNPPGACNFMVDLKEGCEAN
jgi:hypothetical protein